MILISGTTQTMVKVEQLKGATKIPETLELNLADLIDIKGMKAMGNRLSQHLVQSVTLIPGDDDDGTDHEPVPVIDPEPTITPEDEITDDAAPTSAEKTGPTEDTPASPPKSVESKSEESVESNPKESVQSPPPAKKIDFEITNPDDIEIDDKGQLGLF